MTNKYDQQYNTQPNFNAPIVENIVLNKDIDKINHWLGNGSPHKRLGLVAFVKAVSIDWIEGIDAIWKSGWCSNKALITNAWDSVVSSRISENDFNNLKISDWLLNKTFKENVLSKAEFNSLGIYMLERSNYHNCEYVWDVFFKEGLNLKGSKSEELFSSLYYFRYYNENNKFNKNSIKYTKDNIESYQKRIDEVLSNGVQISYNQIFSILLTGNYELFWKILESDLIIDKKDLMVLLILSTMYYKQFLKFSKKEDIDIDGSLERLLNSFIKLGLPEKVSLSSKDIKNKYYNILKNGSGYFSLKSFNCFKFLGYTLSKHIGYIDCNPDEDYVFDIYAGDAFFAEPFDGVGFGRSDDLYYIELTEDQKFLYRNKMKLIFSLIQ